MIEIPTLSSFYPAIEHSIRIAVILAVAFIITKAGGRWIPGIRSRFMQMMTRRQGVADIELEKRSFTLGEILRKSFIVIVWTVAVLMSLKEAGFDIGPILAGAGVVGLAVGFGAQNLVRDVISGMFMLVENQIRINDVAIINGTGGLVEEINLRTTVLRGLDGTVYTFPNGTITSLANMTRTFSYYVFDIRIAYKEDTDRVVEILKQIADGMMQDPEFGPEILEPLEVLGVDSLQESAVIVKVRIKTAPIKQWMVGREMNRRIKKKFDELGIEIPYPHRTLYLGETNPPFKIQLNQFDREQLKALIAEVLRETRDLQPPSERSSSAASGA